MISATESGNKEKENQNLLNYRESLKLQQLTWNWKQGNILEENVTSEKAAIPALLNIKTVATGRKESRQEEVSKHPNPQSARECLRNETFPVVEQAFKIFP